MNSVNQEPSWQHEYETIKQVVNDPLSVIYDVGQWRISKVSPLNNLQYSAVKLKQYASKVKQALASTITTKVSLKYTVTFEAQACLKYSEDDPDALMITVSAVTDSKEKVAYCGILLRWGVGNKLANSTHLPYLLERGEQRLGTAVISTLQSLFDCNIKQFVFSKYQLLLLGFNSIDISSGSREPFTLVYKTPCAEQKDKVKFNFEIEDILIIWNGLKDDAANLSELPYLAYQVLQNQIFHMISLNIAMLDLCEILLPKAEVKSNGTIKMKSPEVVNCVLSVLNGICDLDDSVSDDENYQ